jgi:hypothetical protein
MCPYCGCSDIVFLDEDKGREIMNLYEITKEYREAMDNMEVNEDGEIVNFEEIEAKEGEFDAKAEAIALYIKNLSSDAQAIKTEESNLAERRKSTEKKAEYLKDYLAKAMLAAEKQTIETAKCKLSFRKSTSLNITNEEWFFDKYPELVKMEIKKSIPKKEITELIKSGKSFVGVELVENQNLQIK